MTDLNIRVCFGLKGSGHFESDGAVKDRKLMNEAKNAYNLIDKS